MARIALNERIPQAWLQSIPEPYHVGLPAPDPKTVEGLLCTLNLQVDAELLDGMPRLRVVSNMAVGTDNIDHHACAQRGIAVGNTPGVLTDATADLTMALMLAAARGVPQASRDAAEGKWGPWEPDGWLGLDLRGAALGIVGMGKIGYAVAQRALGFGMRIVYASRSPHPEAEEELGARRLELQEVLKRARVVSLHCPLTPETEGLINDETLDHVQPGTVLVNTARGGVVDQEAVLRALEDGRLGAAALDVTTPEPLHPSHPLFEHPRCLITPHVGSATHNTRRRMAELAVQNLLAGLAGEPLPHRVGG